MNTLVQLRRRAQRQRPEKSGRSEGRDKSTRARAVSHWRRSSVGLTKLATTFCKIDISNRITGENLLRQRFGRVIFLFIAPQMKRVSEDNVAHQTIRMIIREIERGIDLKVRRDVPSEADGR